MLLLKKLGDELLGQLKEVACWLHKEEDMTVMVEHEVYDRLSIEGGFSFLETFMPGDMCVPCPRADLAACLVGHGRGGHIHCAAQAPIPSILTLSRMSPTG